MKKDSSDKPKGGKRRIRSTKKHPVKVITYRPPFTVCNGMVLDGGGFVIAQFQPYEEVKIGRFTLNAAEVVAKAMNFHTQKD